MKKFIQIMNRCLSSFCVLLCVLLVVCVVWQVFSRYILNTPSTYTDEIARFLFIWVGLIGAAYALGQGKHLAIDLLLIKLEHKPQKHHYLKIMITLISLIFTLVIMCYGGGKLVIDTLNGGQISPVLGIQMGLIYLAVPLSGIFMLIYLISDLLNELQAKSLMKKGE